MIAVNRGRIVKRGCQQRSELLQRVPVIAIRAEHARLRVELDSSLELRGVSLDYILRNGRPRVAIALQAAPLEHSSSVSRRRCWLVSTSWNGAIDGS